MSKKEPVLVIIKPDGIKKKIVGHILNKFADTELEMIGLKIVEAREELIREHYKHLEGKSFLDGVIRYFMGEFHHENKLIAIIYYGNNAIKKCRAIAGATSPEEAEPTSIRGTFGRITTKGIFENVVHVSSTLEESRREIKLWFKPTEILIDLYPTRVELKKKTIKKRVWA